MLVSHAHSFRQQARLAVTLAWIAGYTNILTLLACGSFTSHVTGTTSTFGRELFNGGWATAGFALFLITCFFTAAGISGFCTEIGTKRGWESIFVLLIVIETALLGAFAILLERSAPSGHTGPSEFFMLALATAAMGLQNATITQISHGQVRTTHVTGVLSDLGQESVQLCWRSLERRRKPSLHSAANPGSGRERPSGRRLLLLASIFFFFIAGAGLGSWMFAWRLRAAMFPPVLFLLWIIYQDTTTPIAEIQPSTLTISDLPSTLAAFHLRKDHLRAGKPFRIPNLLAWSERLPPETRVVILDVAEIPELNANALLELKVLMQRFADIGRILIIAGMNAAHAEKMMTAAADQPLLARICPDLELAIARGLNFLESPA